MKKVLPLLIFSAAMFVVVDSASAQTTEPATATAVRPRTVRQTSAASPLKPAGTSQIINAPQTNSVVAPTRPISNAPTTQTNGSPTQTNNAPQTTRPAATATTPNSTAPNIKSGNGVNTAVSNQATSQQSSNTSLPQSTIANNNSTAAGIIAPVLPPIAIKPLKPLAPNKIEARIEEARRMMSSRVQLTSLPETSFGTSTPAAPNLYFVTVAALDPDTNLIHTISIPKNLYIKRGTELQLNTSRALPVRVRVLRPNYVNTAIAVFDLTGKQLMPLIVEYPLEKFGKYRETAYYTSAHPSLLSPELVRDGQAYVHTMIELAAKRLKDKGKPIAPEILDVAERLSIVEHVDHQRFLTESRRELYEEIYSLFALNKLDTYRYSVSSAGAGGMVQMIAPTYYMVRQMHPGVGLNPDFVLGMRNHGNALEAMLLYMQGTWNDLLSNPDVADAYYNQKIASRAELIAAGYNSNPTNLGKYLRRGGVSWRTLIPRETQMYLQIYSSFENLIPIKKRVEDKPESKPLIAPAVINSSTSSSPVTAPKPSPPASPSRIEN